MLKRAQDIFRYLEQNNIDAALVFQPENRRYYTGFTGTTGYALFLKKGDALFLTDSRYTVQAHEQCAGYTVVDLPRMQVLYDLLKNNSVRRVAIEEDFITYHFAEHLKQAAALEGFAMLGPVVQQSRLCKDETELALMRRACEITDGAFEHILTVIREGVSENEVEFELQTFMRRYEEVDRSMDKFIVASGVRGAMPHGVASEKKIQKGELITMDYGCCVGGYWSDMTRTVCLGKADTRQKEIYDIVLHAQQVSAAAVTPGKTGRQIDTLARDIIRDAGYGAHFGHGLGHGLGLEVHEAPRLSQSAEGDIALQEGMVVTVEPGIYLEGFGGVRIEDDVVLVSGGGEILNHSPKELIEL